MVVGDVDAGRVLDRLEASLGSWRPGPDTAIAMPAPPPAAPGSETVRLADKANADVVLALPSDLTRTDPDFFACSLANAALGQSSLTSRLGVRVRDTEGLTYGIHSSFSATHVAGPFAVSLTVKPESRDAALASTLDEVRKYVAGGMTEKELAEEKSSGSAGSRSISVPTPGSPRRSTPPSTTASGCPTSTSSRPDRGGHAGAGRCRLRAPRRPRRVHDRQRGDVRSVTCVSVAT